MLITLKKVYGRLSSLANVMPADLQQSYLEIGAKYDIDSEFNMLNDIAKLGEKEYYAPKKFAVLKQADDEIDEEALDDQEEELESERAGYEDYD